MDASSVRSILCRAIDRLALLFRLINPFASYRIYDIEHSQFVGCRGLFEMSVDFLDEYGLGLPHEISGQHKGGIVRTGYSVLSYLDVVHAERG